MLFLLDQNRCLILLQNDSLSDTVTRSLPHTERLCVSEKSSDVCVFLRKECGRWKKKGIQMTKGVVLGQLDYLRVCIFLQKGGGK